MKNIYTRSLFLGIVTVLLAISLLTYRNLINYIDEVSLIRHSNKVLTAVQDVLSSIKDAETGHRGYQLTRDSSYLQPYFNSLTELPSQIKKLDSLLSYNSRQSKKADTLNLLIENQFAIISQILSNAGRSSLYMDQFESHLLARGKDNMTEIRAVARRIVNEEETTFNDRISRETKYRNTAPVALLAYTLIALIGMTFLFIRIVEALNKRRVAEDQLKENVEALRKEAAEREFAQKTLRNVLDNSLDGIMAFKSVRNTNFEVEDFEWIMANSMSSKSMGRSDRELIGKRLLHVRPESKAEGLFEMYKEVTESGRPKEVEKLIEREGVATWFSITIVKLEDGCIATFSDITTQKTQQLLIEERGLLLKEAETLANMGSWKWYGKTDSLIWSDGLYRIWGHRPHAFEPTWSSFLENVYEEDLQAVGDFIQKVRVKRSGSELNYRIEVGGQIKYVLLVPNLSEDSGSDGLSVDILGAVIDVTTQKKAERDMLIAERLSMTGKIARTIAHEVRNPLTSLTLALEQLKDEMPQDDDSLSSYTEVIERNAGRIEQLIGEMLNSSKPKELNLALTNMGDVVEEAIALTIDRINLNQIKLEKCYGEELPRVLLDKEKMKIAFLNIFINAVEAMEPSKGILKIETKRKDGFVIVSISDNGKGIAPRDIDRLFDPFYTGKAGGMGLGLTTAKNILSSHNATIEVRSAINAGTSFYVNFKLAEY
jgi:signal transduction histidine kinase/CHASE3 domain sensor protein